MMDDLTPVLSRLPEPEPPSTLAAAVMARIEREAERQAGATVPAPRHREHRAWLWTVAGAALVLGVSLSGPLETGSLPDFTSSRIGLGRTVLMPIEGASWLFLGLGLVVYLAGLFAPLRNSGRE